MNAYPLLNKHLIQILKYIIDKILPHQIQQYVKGIIIQVVFVPGIQD